MKQTKQDFSFESQGLIPWVELGDWADENKTTCSEYSQAAYQIKGNKAYNSILANSYPLHTPSDKLSVLHWSSSISVLLERAFLGMSQWRSW